MGRILNNGVSKFQVEAIRPTINSYMYGDAKAISKISNITNNFDKVQEFENKATIIKQKLQSRLWNKDLNFFTVLPKDYHKNTKPLNIRELIAMCHGILIYSDDKPEYALAWNKIKDSTGFSAPIGLTVTEQSHHFFEVVMKELNANGTDLLGLMQQRRP